jgi:hypothetical protein
MIPAARADAPPSRWTGPLPAISTTPKFLWVGENSLVEGMTAVHGKRQILQTPLFQTKHFTPFHASLTSKTHVHPTPNPARPQYMIDYQTKHNSLFLDIYGGYAVHDGVDQREEAVGMKINPFRDRSR